MMTLEEIVMITVGEKEIIIPKSRYSVRQHKCSENIQCIDECFEPDFNNKLVYEAEDFGETTTLKQLGNHAFIGGEHEE